jgi:hypothetical protein
VCFNHIEQVVIGMTEPTQEQREDDATDVVAVLALFALVIGTIVFWLSSMPK